MDFDKMNGLVPAIIQDADTANLAGLFLPFFHSFGTRKEISFPASKRLCAAS